MAPTHALSSASGVISLLSEPETELQVYALNCLNDLVDEYWMEISDKITELEVFYETESFPARDLAALVTSKVYFHLGEYADALHFALGAGRLFDVDVKSEYVDTLIEQAIDAYMKIRIENFKAAEEDLQPIDPRLEGIVERMFERCYRDGEYKQALGIALEARRLDHIEHVLKTCPDSDGILNHCFKLSTRIDMPRDFKGSVLQTLVSEYKGLKHPDYFAVTQCLLFLHDPITLAELLLQLAKSKEQGNDLIAFQVAFDLCEDATQHFIGKVVSILTSSKKQLEETGSTASSSSETHTITDLVVRESIAKIEKLLQILSGKLTVELHLEFLYRNNKADLQILKNIKDTVPERNSVLHQGLVFGNAIMHAGTTVDQFLRDNLEWLRRAQNWAKFNATSSLGIIHQGQLDKSQEIMRPYLPENMIFGNSQYSEGGALFALGLIHSHHGQGKSEYLRNALAAGASNTTVQHGACLGLGLVEMATANPTVFSSLKDILYQDDAVAAGAAGVAMGLVMLGTADADSVEEMLTYAHETKHEMIIRGVSLGIALIMYEREDEADVLIDQMCSDSDPIIRYGGMFTIACAYCGSNNNKAIRKLLHVAVSDVSDDVRRSAVCAIGYLLTKVPEQCPRLVRLLAESYNPHVRYGSCMAVGIACAGTAMKEAVELLEPMTKDPVDYVRQGALIALSMIYIQTNEQQEPKVNEFRDLLTKTIGDKHEELLTKFGAILSSGILDAGGRNVTIAFQKNGHNNMRTIAGMCLFLQYWFWYPFIPFISLSFSATAVIGLNEELKMPRLKFRSDARPSLFAYPPPVEKEKKETNTETYTAVLSTAAKAKKREEKKAKEKGKEPAASTSTEQEVAEEKEKGKGKEKEKEKEKEKHEVKEKEKEKSFEILENPARVTKAQQNYIKFDVDERYVPIKSDKLMGILMLQDLKPMEAEDILTPSVQASGEFEKEPEPPEPFEWP